MMSSHIIGRASVGYCGVSQRWCCWWFRNPARKPVDMENLPLFTWHLHISGGARFLNHQQYCLMKLSTSTGWLDPSHPQYAKGFSFNFSGSNWFLLWMRHVWNFTILNESPFNWLHQAFLLKPTNSGFCFQRLEIWISNLKQPNSAPKLEPVNKKAWHTQDMWIRWRLSPKYRIELVVSLLVLQPILGISLRCYSY